MIEIYATTTIKSMLGMIHPDNGTVEYFGKPFFGNEAEIKRRIGYSTGTVSWYPRRKIKDMEKMKGVLEYAKE